MNKQKKYPNQYCINSSKYTCRQFLKELSRLVVPLLYCSLAIWHTNCLLLQPHISNIDSSVQSTCCHISAPQVFAHSWVTWPCFHIRRGSKCVFHLLQIFRPKRTLRLWSSTLPVSLFFFKHLETPVCFKTFT